MHRIYILKLNNGDESAYSHRDHAFKTLETTYHQVGKVEWMSMTSNRLDTFLLNGSGIATGRFVRYFEQPDHL